MPDNDSTRVFDSMQLVQIANARVDAARYHQEQRLVQWQERMQHYDAEQLRVVAISAQQFVDGCMQTVQKIRNSIERGWANLSEEEQSCTWARKLLQDLSTDECTPENIEDVLNAQLFADEIELEIYTKKFIFLTKLIAEQELLALPATKEFVTSEQAAKEKQASHV